MDNQNGEDIPENIEVTLEGIKNLLIDMVTHLGEELRKDLDRDLVNKADYEKTIGEIAARLDDLDNQISSDRDDVRRNEESLYSQFGMI